MSPGRKEEEGLLGAVPVLGFLLASHGRFGAPQRPHCPRPLSRTSERAAGPQRECTQDAGGGGARRKGRKSPRRGHSSDTSICSTDVSVAVEAVALGDHRGAVSGCCPERCGFCFYTIRGLGWPFGWQPGDSIVCG